MKSRARSVSNWRKEIERGIAVLKKKPEELEKRYKWNRPGNERQWKMNENSKRILVDKMRTHCNTEFGSQGIPESMQNVLKRDESF